MEQIDFPANATIFKAGDAATGAFLIQEGQVQLLQGNEVLSELVSGDVFGEMSLIKDGPHSITARAMSAVRLSRLSRTDFERLLTEDPPSVRVYLEALFERLRLLSAQWESPKEDSSASKKGISVTIHPLTRRSAATLPRDGLLISKYPFRIGRAAAENEEIPLALNDLWLVDKSPFSISRNHVSIERTADSVVIKDRGSSLGIIVNDVNVGGDSPIRKLALEEGDNAVVLGGRMSPYQFRIHVTRADV